MIDWLLLGAGFVLFGVIPYGFLNIFLPFIFRDQNLKKRYNAEWALVTGASSGIGKAIARKCAQQRLNVVLVGLPDDALTTTEQELKEAFPDLRFRKVGANLAGPGEQYMNVILEGVVDIDVQLVFNIAGYMVTGLFYNSKIDEQLGNLECNVTSAVRISHFFISKMVAKKLHGCVVFAASPAALLPSPFSCLYGSTKSFLQAFAASLAVEARPAGVDVLAFFPSPTATGFYSAQSVKHKIKILDFFKRQSVQPEALPNTIFGSVGRCVLRDVGLIAIMFRLLSKVVDANLLAAVSARVFHLVPDYKQNKLE